MSKKVYEFKLSSLNRSQIDRLSYELKVQTKIWNTGLALIEWAEWREHWDRISEYADENAIALPAKFIYYPEQKHLAYYCDRVSWSKLGTKSHECKEGEWIEESKDGRFLATPCIPEPVKSHWAESDPPFENHKDPTFSLTSHFAKKNLESSEFWQDVDLSVVTAKYIQGQCKVLGSAWKTYREGKRDRPRYKKYTHSKMVQTLNHYNAKDIRIEGDRIRLPLIGWVAVKDLGDRVNGRSFNPMRLCRKPTGWFLQLTMDDDRPLKKRYEQPNGLIIGVDAGVADVVADDHGHSVKPIDVAAITARIVKLQRKASKQWEMNKDNPNWERKNWRKTYTEIARLYEQIRRHRASLNHYISDRLLSTATVVCIEDLSLDNMTRASKPKYNPELKRYEQNKRKQKAGLNRKMANSAIGDLFSKLETKAKDRNRLVVRVHPRHTSQTCSKCGHIDPQNRPNDRRGSKFFQCVSCGYSADADQNAAANIRTRGLEKLARARGCIKGDRLELPPEGAIEYLEGLRSAIESQKEVQKKSKKSKGKGKGKAA